MKNRLLFPFLLFVVLLSTMPVLRVSADEPEGQTSQLNQDTEVARLLKALPKVSDVTRIASTQYSEKYVLKMEHPLDYGNPSAGTFTQRVFVGHVGFDRPTVIVTEGYGGEREMHPDAMEEVSKLLDANMIFVEYRYFQESMPDPCNWDYLTVWNSLNDLHEVTTTFKRLYPRKWLATGISKGGQTCMFYRAYFPDDVDVSVPYVAPLNKTVEDGRHEPFLSRTVGNARERQAVKEFQIEVLKRRERIEPLLETLCKEKGYKFNENVGIPEVLDMMVLEYSFALWQWGTDVHHIPDLKAGDKVLFDHLVQISGPDYFRPDPYFLSFFVQAARELGYYGYDTKSLRPYLSIKNSKGYLRRLMLPTEMPAIRYDKSLFRHTVAFLRKNDPRMIFIYGENDPWSASGVCTWLDCSKKQNLHIYVDPNGSHTSRIATLPATMREECVRLLKEWME
ncbi:MAG: aminopeptidase [Bacteroidaceae bacterium]|nr:aminopeptidase [Bacteroidaceae bacterium]